MDPKLLASGSDDSKGRMVSFSLICAQLLLCIPFTYEISVNTNYHCSLYDTISV